MDKEIWKDIRGYEGYYQISNLGNIRSIERIIKTVDNKIKKYSSKNISKVAHYKGYDTVSIQIFNKRKRFYVHRLVAEAFIPNPKNKLQVNHINGNKKDNRVENLEWATDLENKQHGIANNLYAKGSKCHKRFTKNNIKYIRNSNKKISELAKDYNVSVNSISNIINYKTYKERK